MLPVIDGLLAARPDLHVLLTTGTRTSAQLAGERLPMRAIHQYVPLDAPRFVRSFLDHWRPDLAVFTESEIWPNLIMEADARDIKIAIVNGRMSPKSFGNWSRFGRSARSLFGRVDLALAQNRRMAMRFQRLGARTVEAPGNLKVDSPPPPVDDEALSHLRDATSGRSLLLAASTHPGEDEQVIAAHRRLRSARADHLTIIVPRHPERGIAIGDMARGEGLTVAMRSDGALPAKQHDIYVADTLGELGTFYALCSNSFIGGSLVPHGGQNPIEAVKLGSTVLAGPHTGNFRDTYRALDDADGVVRVTDAARLANAFEALRDNATNRETVQRNAERAVGTLSGALARTIEALLARVSAPADITALDDATVQTVSRLASNRSDTQDRTSVANDDVNEAPRAP